MNIPESGTSNSYTSNFSLSGSVQAEAWHRSHLTPLRAAPLLSSFSVCSACYMPANPHGIKQQSPSSSLVSAALLLRPPTPRRGSALAPGRRLRLPHTQGCKSFGLNQDSEVQHVHGRHHVMVASDLCQPLSSCYPRYSFQCSKAQGLLSNCRVCC